MAPCICGNHQEDYCPLCGGLHTDEQGCVNVTKEDQYREVLEDIYANARMFGHRADGSGGPGVCRWCDAPPPTEDTDHDVACPAAKAGYALDKPGYHHVGSTLRSLKRIVADKLRSDPEVNRLTGGRIFDD